MGEIIFLFNFVVGFKILVIVFLFWLILIEFGLFMVIIFDFFYLNMIIVKEFCLSCIFIFMSKNNII